MKKFLIILSLLLVVVIGVILSLPSIIDWNEHKDAIVSKFTEVTGKEMLVDGNLDIKIFPEPSITANNVKVLNVDGGKNTNMIEVENVVVNVGLLSLISGDIDVKRVSLVKPKFFVEMMENGKLNTAIPFDAEKREQLNKNRLSFNSVTIENGELRYRDIATDVERVGNRFNAEIIADSLLGPYRIEGSFVKEKEPVGFAFSIGKLGTLDPCELNLVLTHPDTESFINFSGSVVYAEEGKVVNGNLNIEVKKLEKFLSKFVEQKYLAPNVDHPIFVNSAVTANINEVEFSNLVFRYGTSEAAGNAFVDLKHIIGNNDGDQNGKTNIEAKINFTNIDPQPLISSFRHFNNLYETGKDEFSITDEIVFLADIDASKASYNGSDVRDISFSFDMKDGKFVINELKAYMPGNTVLDVRGDITSKEGLPFFNANYNVSSSNFRNVIKWLGYQEPEYNNTIFRTSSLKGSYLGTLKDFSISDVELAFDKTLIKGGGNFSLGNRNSIGLGFSMDNINLDSYLPDISDELSKLKLSDRIRLKFNKLSLLKDFDVNLKTKIGLIVYENLPNENVKFDASLKAGELEVKSLDIGNAAGVSMKVSGTVDGFGGEPKFRSLTYDVNSNDPKTFLNRLEWQVPIFKDEYLKNVKLRGILDGDLNNMSVTNIANIGEFYIKNKGDITTKINQKYFDMDVEMRHSEFSNFVNMLGFDYEPNAGKLGVFKLLSKINGSVHAYNLSDMRMSIGLSNFNGSVQVDKNTPKTMVITKFDSNEFNINKFLEKKKYKIKKEDARAFLDFIKSYAQHINESHLVLVNQEVTAKDLYVKKKPKWSVDHFDLSILSQLNFDAEVKVGKLYVGKHLIGNTSFVSKLKDNVLTINDFVGNYKEGTLKTNLTLSAAGEPSLKGDFVVNNAKIGNSLFDAPLYDVMECELYMEGNFDTNGRSVNDFYHNLNSTFNYELTDGYFKGFDLASIIMDYKERENVDSYKNFMTDKLTEGDFKFTKNSGQLVMNRGNIRLVDAKIEGQDLEIGVKNVMSIADWNMESEFDIKVKDMPSYKLSLKGDMHAPEMSVDITGLEKSLKEKIEKEKAEKIAEEKAQLELIRSSILRQKERLKKVKGLVDNVMQEITIEVSKTDDKVVIEKKNIIDKINAKIDEDYRFIIVMFKKEEFTSADIDKIKDRITEMEKQSKLVLSEKDDIIIDSKKSRIRKVMTVIELNNIKFSDVMKNVSTYITDTKAKFKECESNIDIDAKIFDPNSAINTSSFVFEKTKDKVAGFYDVLKTSTNIVELDKVIVESGDTSKLMEAELEKISVNFAKIQEIWNPLLETEQTIYEKRKDKATKERIVSDNVGMIKTSKGKMIIKKSYDEIIGKKKTLEKLPQIGDNIRSSILKPIEDEISKEGSNNKVSGTITR